MPQVSPRLAPALTFTLFSLPCAALADIVHNEDVVISSSLLCVGTTCANGENNPTTGDLIKIKGQVTGLRFIDISDDAGFPTHNWEITANENDFQGDEALFFGDLTANTRPFVIRGSAPNNSLYIAPDGKVGVGTSAPSATLHVFQNNSPSIRLHQASPVPHTWEVLANHGNIFVRDASNDEIPFVIRTGAQDGAVVVDEDGNIGFGTLSPDAPLEVSSDGTFNFMRLTAEGAAVNTSVDITFTGGPLGTGQLRYNIVDGDNQEMSLDADGNMVLDGTLTTTGPTCAGGCDRVFDADYPLASIEDRAAGMFAQGHLPAIGPTVPNARVNVTEKMGNMLNELEHAHIYITQLHQRLAAQEAFAHEQAALNTALMARLEAIEAQ